MGWVEKSWTDEIAGVLNTPEYHRAVIAILDPSLVTSTWDIDTNQKVMVGSPVVASGIHARINWPLRSVADPGATDFDATTIRSGRCSIDSAEFSGPLRNGMQIVVTDGARNPDLRRYRFRISEAQNSTEMVSRVFKITVDGEAVLAPSVITGTGGGQVVPAALIGIVDNGDGTYTIQDNS